MRATRTLRSKTKNRVIGIESADGFRVTVRQIAGLICAADCELGRPGRDTGEGRTISDDSVRVAVELFLPHGTEIAAKVGDYAKGGETIIARRK